MGVDGKYGRVTVEHVRSTPIGDDEPVVLFRAQDQLLPKVLEYYASLCAGAGCSAEHMRAVYKALGSVQMWQADVPPRRPGEPLMEEQ